MTVYLTLFLHMNTRNKNFALKGDRINSEWHRRIYIRCSLEEIVCCCNSLALNVKAVSPFIFPASRYMKLIQNYMLPCDFILTL